MNLKQSGGPLIWVISVAVALLVATAALLLVEFPRRQELPKARLGGGLGLQRLEADKSLAEQIELHDPMPLFLPTGASRRLGGQGGVSELESGHALNRAFSGKLAYGEDSASVAFPARPSIPARPAEALGLGEPELPFLGFGRKDRVIAAPPTRSAYIEVVVADTGKIVMGEAIRDPKVPAASDWQPLEMLIVIDRIGWGERPTISRTSTVDAVDGFFRDYVDKGLHLAQKLAPGSYVVTIGR